ncbi:MAG: Fpg/Nei family DNA glycosylase, partial [Microbacteriaceae bacterium]|nr:Fpg/Nei family DNA glycosylase [Microbacteriaceae bacterium]
MPEMPETEALARFLTERAAGRRIEQARAFNAAVLKTFDPPLEALAGRTVGATTRHGKFLAIETAGATPGDGTILLVIHFALAGWLRWY